MATLISTTVGCALYRAHRQISPWLGVKSQAFQQNGTKYPHTTARQATKM
jgi:hypothetical protein